MIQAAHGAKNKRKSFYRNKYNKLKFKLGSANKAKVAIANRIARAVFCVLAGAEYKEIGYQRAKTNQDKIETLVKQLKNLGVKIRYENHEQVVTEIVKIDSTGVSLEKV